MQVNSLRWPPRRRPKVPTMRTALRLAFLPVMVGLCAALAGPALAQAVAPAPEAADTAALAIEARVRELAQEGMRTGAPTLPRIEVSVGALDPRLHLAPCQRIEPYLPDGMRLWGKSRIGLRCTQGAVKWNVFLPVTVRAFGTGLVATAAAGAGSVLGAADVTIGEVDLAEDPSAAVQDPERAVGRELTRAVRPGQSVRQSHLKARQYFSAGETVSLVAQGPGFSVEGEGQALSNGVEGQPVRVRTEAGRVVTGQAVGGRRVDVSL